MLFGGRGRACVLLRGNDRGIQADRPDGGQNGARHAGTVSRVKRFWPGSSPSLMYSISISLSPHHSARQAWLRNRRAIFWVSFRPPLLEIIILRVSAAGESHILPDHDAVRHRKIQKRRRFRKHFHPNSESYYNRRHRPGPTPGGDAWRPGCGMRPGGPNWCL